MSNLVKHAERELDLIGLPSEPHIEEGYSIDYDYEIRQSVLALVAMFAEQGHSGMSASIVTQLLHPLLQFEELSPITDNPLEWNMVSNSPPMWQNRRASECFSYDGGSTYWRLSKKREWLVKLIVKLPWSIRRHFNKQRGWIHPMTKSKAMV